MVKFNRASLFKSWLSSTIQRGRRLCVSGRMIQYASSIRELRGTPLLLLMDCCSGLLVVCRVLRRRLVVWYRSIPLSRWAEHSFGTLDAVLRLLPAPSSLCAIVATTLIHCGFGKSPSGSSYRLYCRSHWRCYSNCIRIVARTALNTVTWGEEGIESLNEIWMSSKEFRYSVYNSRCVDTIDNQHMVQICGGSTYA